MDQRFVIEISVMDMDNQKQVCHYYENVSPQFISTDMIAALKQAIEAVEAIKEVEGKEAFLVGFPLYEKLNEAE